MGKEEIYKNTSRKQQNMSQPKTPPLPPALGMASKYIDFYEGFAEKEDIGKGEVSFNPNFEKEVREYLGEEMKYRGYDVVIDEKVKCIKFDSPGLDNGNVRQRMGWAMVALSHGFRFDDR